MSAKIARFLSTKEVADLFGVDPMTIYRKAKRGDLPAIKFGKNWVFPEDALQEWVALNLRGKKKSIAIDGQTFQELPHLMLVYLFGSRASGHEMPKSDVDIAYLDDGTVKPFDFEFELERAMRARHTGLPRIDLVRLNAAPIAVRYKVIKTGRLLYARTDDVRAAFEEDTLSRYFDYEPVLSKFYGEVA